MPPTDHIYIIDSLPIAVCDKYRIRRCKLYRDKACRGIRSASAATSTASRFTWLVTQTGKPVESFLSPGAISDTAALDQFDIDLPPEPWIVGDKAYNAYLTEEIMADCDLFLLLLRKDNSKRPHPSWLRYLLATCRKTVETAGSQIE